MDQLQGAGQFDLPLYCGWVNLRGGGHLQYMAMELLRRKYSAKNDH